MLFAVEGGGFFSSSASGYSKGLTLLILGQKNVEKPVRVLPWNQHYQLVDQEPVNPPLQLARGKKRLVRGCATFFCFGRTAAGPQSSSAPKVGPTQSQDVIAPGPAVSDTQNAGVVDEEIDSTKKIGLKSSLKKKKDTAIHVPAPAADEGELIGENGGHVSGVTERRSIQWQDFSGGELADVREFEPSEDLSDDEFDYQNETTCACKIM